ncbi:PA2778 family cysteine peptidase [Parahaliea aestuarii]|uniref:Peptidase C39 family protein n=1 Tax=Parahaliea aestuarii TaxID=1852021 RepID=A0A5C9A4L7_9GAMM|nr:PA2778 family cysteine peptidase [Parahaliea aestuarii]TXS94922.1 peptidase C39 family protein [Parahaliea aestuarii]
MTAGRLLSVFLLGAALSACGTFPDIPPAPDSASVELDDVPFFPQSRYQCGPAALATTLNYSGVDIDDRALEQAVFLPGREGSLQAELLAASRRHGRIPYRIAGNPEALTSELAAGNPVLVMQNLGIDALPQWHYAVVVGYHSGERQWLLRSGTERRHTASHTRFLISWQKAAYWAAVTLPPGRLPASATPATVTQALADAERVMGAPTVLPGWEAAVTRWPGQAELLFGAANAQRSAGHKHAASQRFEQLLISDPEHYAGRNNYADLLLALGCPASARTVLAPAQQARGLAPALEAVIAATAGELDQYPAQPDREDCPAAPS